MGILRHPITLCTSTPRLTLRRTQEEGDRVGKTMCARGWRLACRNQIHAQVSHLAQTATSVEPRTNSNWYTLGTYGSRYVAAVHKQWAVGAEASTSQ